MRLIYGSLLTVFLLLTLPSIPAMQFNMVEKANETYFNKQIIEYFKDFFKYLNIKKLSFSNLIETLGNNNKSSDDPQPLFFPILGILVYGLIFIIFIKIILLVARGVGDIIQTISNHIKERIFNFLTAIINIIGFILKIITFIITGIIKIIHFTGKVILNLILILLTGIWYFIGTIITLIILLAEKLWNILGTIIGLILNILLLIYDTIFHPSYSTTI